MNNRLIVKLWIIGVFLAGAGGFVEGFNGQGDGVSALLSGTGTIGCFVMAIWAMVRLWKTPDTQ
jgi:hypothetical protein